MPKFSFIERALLGGCIDTLRRQTSDAKRLVALNFLATYDKSQWGHAARVQTSKHIHRAIVELHDVITPKPMIRVRSSSASDIMRGLGAGFFMSRGGLA